MDITRLVALDDAPALADLLRVNREFFAPWSPVRGDRYFTADGQYSVIREDLQQYAQGSKLPHVILDDSGHITAPEYLNIAGRWQDHAVYQVVKPTG